MSAVNPALVSVLVVLIPEFARRPVAEQARLKARVEDLVLRALKPVPPGQRIMLDAVQGIAVAILDSPAAAFELAERAHAVSDGLPLCIGLNHGPITILDDPAGGRGLVGDGLAAGMIMAAIATPGRLIASRAFYDALRASAPASAARLASTGKHTDSQVRTHDLYTLDARAAQKRRLRLAAVGFAAFAGILGLGYAMRMVVQATGVPAIVELQIAPEGDVYVDGVVKGTSPPLTRLEIAPGRHTIEVRNGWHTPMAVDINPAAGEVTTIAYDFGSTGSGKKLREGLREGWQSFRSAIGF